MRDSSKLPKPNAPPRGVADAPVEFTVISIEGGVWACAPVSERPEVVLTRWRVYEVALPGDTKRTRHFVGYNPQDREGRVSSAIVQFDTATMCGVTQSGRVYELRGKSGWDGDADYTWNRWKGINGVTEAVDVTGEIKNSMEQP